MTGAWGNAGKVEGLFDAFEAGGPDAASQLIDEIFDPGVEFNPLPAGGAGGRTYRGLDGVRGFFSELHEAVEEVRYESRQFYSMGEDRVIVFTELVGIDRGSSAPLRQELSLVYVFAA